MSLQFTCLKLINPFFTVQGVKKRCGNIKMPSTVSTPFGQNTSFGTSRQYSNIFSSGYIVYGNGFLYPSYIASSVGFTPTHIGIYNIASPPASGSSLPVMKSLSSGFGGLTIDSTASYVYASGNDGYVYKISTTSPYNSTQLLLPYQNDPNIYYFPGPIAVDTNGNIYVFDTIQYSNTIVKRDTSGNVTVVSTNAALANTSALVITSNNNTLYAVAGQTIQRITISGGAITQIASNSLLSGSNGMVINQNNTYLFGTNGSQISSVRISDGNVQVRAGTGNSGIVNGAALSTAQFYIAYGICADTSDNMYISDAIPYGSSASGYVRLLTNFDPDPYVPPGPSPACFMEGTKILTDKGYVPIENLRKGDKVQTLKDGFVPIHAIGKRRINHPCVEERISEQMYVCSSKNYPQVFEDLVMTGYHSLLAENFESDAQIDETKKVLGKIYITDGQYRIPICIDKRAEVYKEKGSVMIYHFALEHYDYDMNHGVYANGLLVESTSKKYLIEKSGMELL